MDGKWKVIWEDGNSKVITIKRHSWNLLKRNYQIQFDIYEDQYRPWFQWPELSPSTSQTVVQTSATSFLLGTRALKLNENIEWTTTHPSFPKITWTRLSYPEDDNEVSKSDSSVDDWLVVDNNRVETDHNEDTEAIALAAQLIGSSLFNSGMESHTSREEEVSALTGCSVSTASSVPTNLASSITSSDSLCQRWEPQLKQLKELGFDEKRCVDILEKLETPDEEITVAQVVNELFK